MGVIRMTHGKDGLQLCVDFSCVEMFGTLVVDIHIGMDLVPARDPDASSIFPCFLKLLTNNMLFC